MKRIFNFDNPKDFKKLTARSKLDFLIEGLEKELDINGLVSLNEEKNRAF
jgi:hypothetical protein